MTDWFEGLAGPEFATAVIWTLAALVLLVVVLVVVRFVRSMTFGTFVAGGRNRKTRLAVMDATAVDSHRRLVLVRRDDIEHLLLIGGPTDVVVEREIRVTNARRPQSAFGPQEDDHELPPQPAQSAELPPAPRPRAPEPAKQRQPLPIRAAAPPPARVSQPARQPEYQPEHDRAPIPAPRPARQAAPRPSSSRDLAPPPRPSSARLPPANLSPGLPAASAYSSSYASTSGSTGMKGDYASQSSNTLDDALMRELEVTFDPLPPQGSTAGPEMTLDDEMTKLLGELSNNKR